MPYSLKIYWMKDTNLFWQLDSKVNGGRFLVGLKDTVYSEKILKIKSLMKEGIDIDEDVKENRHENM